MEEGFLYPKNLFLALLSSMVMFTGHVACHEQDYEGDDPKDPNPLAYQSISA